MSAIDTSSATGLPPPEAQPEFLFDLPELHYPERLNAAVELIDKQRSRRARRDQRCRRAGPMARCSDLSDRIARLLVEEEDLVPGNRVLPARAQQRDAVRRLARRAQGGRHRRRDHADASPRRDRDDPRARAGQPRHRRRPLPRRFRRRRRDRPIRSLLTYDGDTATAARAAAGRRSRPASRRSTPTATTSP